MSNERIKYHINKHGVPALCTRNIESCDFGGASAHFPTYELAKEYADKIFESVRGNVVLQATESAQKIRSYYLSASAINEFYKNRKIANIADFDLIIISWLTMDSINENMKYNKVGKVNFTYGDIVRMMEEELRVKTGKTLNLKKYINFKPLETWERQMKEQHQLYENTVLLSKELGFNSMEPICLPMKSRKRLEKDGFIRNAENINEVVYQVKPSISQFGDIISYNHSTNKVSKEFDIYEIAGVIEGKTLYETCYVNNKRLFEEAWNERDDLKSLNYDLALERYKQRLFFKGIEGLDVPKALIRMSPMIAKEVSEFVGRYRAIMGAIGEILGDENVPSAIEEDEDDWIIE